MKHLFSLIAVAFICIVLVQYRGVNSDINTGHKPLKVTEWDAFGYYVYLPAMLIYNDCTQLDWLTDVDKKYAVTGGNGWQAQKTENGKYVFKYLGGVALMQLPFFWTGHFVAKHTNYPQDGFSPPYQYALGFGIILYCVLAILLLRNILLRYFSDITTAITLVMVCLATNFIQYAAIDNGQSHAYLFVLYVLILYATIKWHEQPRALWAILIGYILGLATMTRPTDAIMLFIPLLWNTQNKNAATAKWQLVKDNKTHLMYAGIAGIIGILPQLIYWKATTDSFIYDVGSKWDFLNPHFRVLFGWEKGWFIYTPVTVLFIAGMFFIKKFPFRKSVLWFCLLNIYIIIGWHEWRYGGSYSTRALVQSYPIFALPFAALTEHLLEGRRKLIFLPVLGYLLAVNLFQIVQYCATVLHYDDMNRMYYGSIYLNPAPTPVDMSLLDNDEILRDESNYKAALIADNRESKSINFKANENETFAALQLNCNQSGSWLKIECDIQAPDCLWQSFLQADLVEGDSVKHTSVRLFSPISKNEKSNSYAFYVSIPEYLKHARLKLSLTSSSDFKGTVRNTKITLFEK